LVVYAGLGLLMPKGRPDVDDLVDSLITDPAETAGATVGRRVTALD
jgi:hypothetical protein